MSYTIESIAEYIGARRVGEHEATIDWLPQIVLWAFRKETLFFALPTKRNNGARYISELYDRGVQLRGYGRRLLREWEWRMEMENASCSRMQVRSLLPTRLSILDFSNFLIVANPLKALQKAGRGSSGEFQDSGNRYHGQ